MILQAPGMGTLNEEETLGYTGLVTDGYSDILLRMWIVRTHQGESRGVNNFLHPNWTKSKVEAGTLPLRKPGLRGTEMRHKAGKGDPRSHLTAKSSQPTPEFYSGAQKIVVEDSEQNSMRERRAQQPHQKLLTVRM